MRLEKVSKGYLPCSYAIAMVMKIENFRTRCAQKNAIFFASFCSFNAMGVTGCPTGLVHGLQIDMDESIDNLEHFNRFPKGLNFRLREFIRFFFFSQINQCAMSSERDSFAKGIFSTFAKGFLLHKLLLKVNYSPLRVKKSRSHDMGQYPCQVGFQ
jgi:hypothetical protein